MSNPILYDQMKTTLEILSNGITEQRINALLIGGYALQAYNVTRQTVDVDCLIADLDAKKLDKILSKAGYIISAKTDNFSRYTNISVYLMDVDVLYVDRSTMDKMIASSKVCKIGNAEFRIPSLIHIIALKLHAIKNNPKREPRDLADIAELIRIHADLISAAELRNVCKSFGPKGITDKVINFLK